MTKEELLENYIRTLEVATKKLSGRANLAHRERLIEMRDHFQWWLQKLTDEAEGLEKAGPMH